MNRLRSGVVALVLVVAFYSCVSSPMEESTEAVTGVTSREKQDSAGGTIVEQWTVGAAEFEVGVPGGSLRVELPDPPDTFNPAGYAGDPRDDQVLSLLFSPLLDVHRGIGISGNNLASSHSLSADGRQLDIGLKSNLRWSDGTALTARDVLYSYNNIYLEPELSGIAVSWAEELGELTIEQTGEHSLRITCARPGQALLDIAALPPLPRHVIEPWIRTHAPAEFPDFWAFYADLSGHVGSGPFVLRSYEEGRTAERNDRVHAVSVVELGRNPHYHMADANGTRLPYLDAVTLLIRENPFTPSLLYWDDVVDVAYLPFGGPDGQTFGYPGIPLRTDALEAGGAAPGQHYLVTDTATFVETFVAFNMQRAPGPNDGGLASPLNEWFNDIRFRAAVSHLIPRQRIVDELHEGDATIALSWIPEHSIIHSADVAQSVPGYDPAAADALLTEMGLVDRDGDGVREDADGTPLSFTLKTNENNPYRVRLLELLASEWADAGIEVVAEPLEWESLLNAVHAATYEGLLLGFTGADGMSDGWDIWGSAGDLHLWDLGQEAPKREWEADLDALIAEWQTTVDSDRLVEIERQIAAIIAEQLPLLTVTRRYDYLLMRRPYRNLRRTGFYRHLLPLERVFIAD